MMRVVSADVTVCDPKISVRNNSTSFIQDIIINMSYFLTTAVEKETERRGKGYSLL